VATLREADTIFKKFESRVCPKNNDRMRKKRSGNEHELHR
jgi:hypothetical protein